MKFLFLLILLPASFVEVVVYHHFGISLIGTIWFALLVQADWAAQRFLREGLIWKERPEANGKSTWLPPEEEEVVKVQPLGRKSRHETRLESKPRSRAEPRPKQGPLPASPSPKPRRKIRALPKMPNFFGKPHEVLGVAESAATTTIANAFRHWIKRFHPDPSGQDSNNERARQLVEAKQSLMQKRQRLRDKKAA